MFADQPDCAMILSWHIADELAPNSGQKASVGN